MLDIQKIKNDFHALPLSRKYDELVKIFLSIKDKNENCAYIYEKLTIKPELFDEILMEEVFGEVMEVYERIQKENTQNKHTLLQRSKSYLEQLQQKEAQQSADEAEEVEALLQF